MKSYDKPPLSIKEQIDLLLSRGLHIPDRGEAERFLSSVSYYRLRGYTYPYQDNTGKDHPFIPGTSLQWIQNLYEFDRQLRLRAMDGIERVEVAFRSQLVLHLSLHYGWWWFEKPELFRYASHHSNDLSELREQIVRSSDPFITDHFNRYGDSSLPPACKTFETVSFGLISKIFKNLKGALPAKKAICRFFGLRNNQFFILESWLQHLNVIRNICAHHGRLWDRLVTQVPQFTSQLQSPWISSFHDSRKRYATLSLLVWLNRTLTGSESFKKNLLALFDEYEQIPLERMGFPEDWSNMPLWQNHG